MEPGSIVIVDSAGLKLHGKGESHQIVACELTTMEIGDPTAVPDLEGRLQ